MGIIIIISEKTDFKAKAIKKKHSIMIQGSIKGEDITLIRLYAPNIGAPKYTKQILTDIKGEIDGNTIIVGNFSTIFTSMERSSRQKINDTLQQI